MVTIWHSATIRCANSLLPDFWPLYRFDPRRADEGKLPLALDSRPPSEALEETLLHEQRFRRLNSQQPEVAEQLWKDAAADLQKRYDFLAQMAGKAEKATPIKCSG